MTEKDLLDQIVDSIIMIGRIGSEQGVTLAVRPHRDVNEYIEEPPICDWLAKGSRLSDDAINIVASRLPEKLENIPSMDKVMADILKEEYKEESTFDYAIKLTCKAVLNDMENNGGEKFRKLVESTDFMIISQIVGNEQLRDWLGTRPGKANVYDYELAIVEAMILYIASILTQNADEEGEFINQN